MADYAGRMRGLGVELVGGCCGSTPAHMAAMAAVLTTLTAICNKSVTTSALATTGDCPRLQVIGVGGGSPASTAIAFLAASTPIAVRVSIVAEPRCGISTTFSSS